MVSVKLCRVIKCDNLKFNQVEQAYVCDETGLMPRYMDTCVVEKLL